jgi:hypothetical protein
MNEHERQELFAPALRVAQSKSGVLAAATMIVQKSLSNVTRL